MRNRPRHRIDRSTAEQLLRGDHAGARPEAADLSRVLAAAAAPARKSELAGERAALNAFRDARLASARRPRRRAILAKLAPVKVLAAVAASTAFGGVGLAASTGSLPAPIQDVAHGVLGAPPANTAPPASTPPSAIGSSSASPTEPTPGSSTGGPTAGPTAALVNLCRVYQARRDQTGGANNDGGQGTDDGRDKGGRGKPSDGNGNDERAGDDESTGDGSADDHEPSGLLDDPAFAALVSAAGSKKEVAAYCAELTSRAGRLPGEESGDQPGTPRSPAGVSPGQNGRNPNGSNQNGAKKGAG